MTVETPVGAGREERRRTNIALGIWLGLSLLLIVVSFLPGSERDPDELDAIYRYSTVVAGLVQSAFLIAVALGAGGLLPGRSRDLGFAPFRGRDVAQAFGVVVVAIVVALALEPVLEAGEKQGLAPDEWRSDLVVPFVLNVVLFAVIGPFTEELFWRGLGGAVLRRYGIPIAVVGTTLMWGLVHGLLEALPTLAVLGVGFAWIRMRSGSIWPTFIAHGTYNAIAIAFSVALN